MRAHLQAAIKTWYLEREHEHFKVMHRLCQSHQRRERMRGVRVLVGKWRGLRGAMRDKAATLVSEIQFRLLQQTVREWSRALQRRIKDQSRKMVLELKKVSSEPSASLSLLFACCVRRARVLERA